MSHIDVDCVILDLKAADCDQVILLLAGLLEKKGYVNMRFGHLAVQREQTFPTGIPAQPFSIAFPHVVSATVYHSSLAIATLTQPVSFRSMEDPNINLPVRAVFLLASQSPREHVATLKRFTRFFQTADHLGRLFQISTAEEMATWLEKSLFTSVE